MPRLSDQPETRAALEALREVAPPQSHAVKLPYSQGVWEGGRVYVDDEGGEHFLPIGAQRKSLRKKRLTFVGDGQRNIIGYGEIRLTNEVQP
jgi:hypothetical protein